MIAERLLKVTFSSCLAKTGRALLSDRVRLVRRGTHLDPLSAILVFFVSGHSYVCVNFVLALPEDSTIMWPPILVFSFELN